MNAQIGKNGNHKYSLNNTSNRNGQHLIDFPIENRLTCLYTNFQKREGKLWTYTYANNTKAQIDYVFMNKKWKNSAVNWQGLLLFRGCVFRSPNIHGKNTIELTKEYHPNNDHQALLNNKDIKDRYAIALRNKFDALRKTETRTPNDEYEHFVNAHLEAAAKYIPTKQRTKSRVSWEALAVREKHSDGKTAI